MRTTLFLLFNSVVDGVNHNQQPRGQGRIARQAAAGLAYLSQSAMGNNVAMGNNLAPQATNNWELAAYCPADQPNCTGPSPSPEEQALIEEIGRAKSMLASLQQDGQDLQVELSGLTSVGLPLTALIGMITPEQRAAVMAALASADPIKALDDLVDDSKTVNPIAQFVPGFAEMVTTLKKLDATSIDLHNDYVPIPMELVTLKQRFQDYIAKDKTDGSLVKLIEEFVTLEHKLVLGAITIQNTIKTVVTSLMECAKNTIMNRSFDNEDWQKFLDNVKEAVAEGIFYKQDIEAIQRKFLEIEQKINHIIHPDMMEIEDVN